MRVLIICDGSVEVDLDVANMRFRRDEERIDGMHKMEITQTKKLLSDAEADLRRVMKLEEGRASLSHHISVLSKSITDEQESHMMEVLEAERLYVRQKQEANAGALVGSQIAKRTMMRQAPAIFAQKARDAAVAGPQLLASLAEQSKGVAHLLHRCDRVFEAQRDLKHELEVTDGTGAALSARLSRLDERAAALAERLRREFGVDVAAELEAAGIDGIGDGAGDGVSGGASPGVARESLKADLRRLRNTAERERARAAEFTERRAGLERRIGEAIAALSSFLATGGDGSEPPSEAMVVSRPTTPIDASDSRVRGSGAGTSQRRAAAGGMGAEAMAQASMLARAWAWADPLPPSAAGLGNADADALLRFLVRRLHGVREALRGKTSAKAARKSRWHRSREAPMSATSANDRADFHGPPSAAQQTSAEEWPLNSLNSLESCEPPWDAKDYGDGDGYSGGDDGGYDGRALVLPPLAARNPPPPPSPQSGPQSLSRACSVEKPWHAAPSQPTLTLSSAPTSLLASMSFLNGDGDSNDGSLRAGLGATKLPRRRSLGTALVSKATHTALQHAGIIKPGRLDALRAAARPAPPRSSRSDRQLSQSLEHPLKLGYTLSQPASGKSKGGQPYTSGGAVAGFRKSQQFGF